MQPLQIWQNGSSCTYIHPSLALIPKWVSKNRVYWSFCLLCRWWTFPFSRHPLSSFPYPIKNFHPRHVSCSRSSVLKQRDLAFSGYYLVPKHSHLEQIQLIFVLTSCPGFCHPECLYLSWHWQLLTNNIVNIITDKLLSGTYQIED